VILTNNQKVQTELLEHLNNGNGNKKFKIISNTYVYKKISSIGYYYDFLDLISPLLDNKKVLDVFCGRNPIKLFTKILKIKCEVVGVDKYTDEADIKMDVADVGKYMTNNSRFEIVTAFGAMGIENDWVKDVIKHLTNNGLVITKCSNYWYNNRIVCNGKYKNKSKDDVFNVLKTMCDLKAIVVIVGLHGYLEKKLGLGVIDKPNYLIWKIKK
jgi:hypothetical protein